MVAAVVVLAGSQLITTASAATHPNLPARTAAALLTAVQTSNVQHLSGTVTETAALGLPSLPGADNSASLSWQSLISGAHTMRVWVAGPTKQRIALLGTLSESDVVHNGRDVWTYSSDRNEVSHIVLPAHRGHAEKTPRTGQSQADSYTPMGVANEILKAVEPSTQVTVGRTQVVDGHSVYTLVLTPRDSRSTIHKVAIAIDSTHFVPLQVQVFGAGASPAFQIGFTRGLSFAAPPDSLFDFHAPAGASVSTDPLMGHDRGARTRKHVNASSPTPKAGVAKAGAGKMQPPTIIGTGWTAVAYFPHGLPTGSGGLLDKATSPIGSTGDRVLTTTLLSVLFTADGRVFVGPVSPSMLEHVASTTPR